MTFSHQPRWSPTPQSKSWESSLFPGRSWQPRPETQIEEDSQDRPDLQAQLDRANHLGHNFGNIPLLNPTPTVQAQTQPHPTEEQEPESTASEPRFSFAWGSEAPPPTDFPDSSSGSTQPLSFLQRSPFPIHPAPAPRISRPTSVATELAQLLQAKEDSSESEPQSTPPATLQDEIGAVDTLLLQQIPLLSQRLLQASQQGIVQPSTFDTWDQLSQALISAYPATQAAQRGEVAVPEAQQQDIADLSQDFFASLQQDMIDSAGVGKLLPPEIAGAGRILSEMASESRWSELYRKYYSVSAGLDRWLSTQALFAGDEQASQESEQRAEQTAGLSKVRDQLVDLKEVNPTRIPVTFTLAPEEKEQEELTSVPEAIPMSFYLWQAEDQWHLRQVVPGGPFTNTVPIQEGQKEPPPELFAELDSKLRFPKGTLRYQIPGGREGEVQVTGQMTVQEILGWVALALGLAALAATGVGALAGGAGLAALAGSAKGVAFTLAVGSTVAGAGSSGLSLGEQFQHGNPDGMQVTLDVVGLASSVLSLGSLVTGRIVVSQGARGTALGNLAGRSYIPLVAGTMAADAAGLTLLVVEAPGQIQAVMEGEGTEEEKLRALAVLLSQLAVGGVLTTLSLQGDLADIHSGGVLGIDVENGVSVGRMVGDTRAPEGRVGEIEAGGPIRSEVRIEDSIHSLLPQQWEGRTRLVMCSVCDPLTTRIDELLVSSDLESNVRTQLEQLKANVESFEARIDSENLSPQDITRETDRISEQLRGITDQHPTVAETLNTGGSRRITDPRIIDELPPGEARTSGELRRARNYYKNHKDEAIRRWEERAGEDWPTGARAEHIRPLADGGHPLIVEPRFGDSNTEHMVLGEDGLTDQQRWGARRRSTAGQSPERIIDPRIIDELPPGEIRTPEELRKAREYFRNHRDEAIRRWEEHTGEDWPAEARAEHIRPLADGGHPLIIEPRFGDSNTEHMIPGEDGLTDQQRWGARRRPQED